jgi:transposase
MSNQFKEYNLNQILLLPPNLRDWLPSEHLVYFVSDVVDQLDISDIQNSYGNDGRGQPRLS